MLYPLYYGQVLSDGLKAKQISGVSLIRSAWAGTQRTGAAVYVLLLYYYYYLFFVLLSCCLNLFLFILIKYCSWSGDTESSFATLAKQVSFLFFFVSLS